MCVSRRKYWALFHVLVLRRDVSSPLPTLTYTHNPLPTLDPRCGRNRSMVSRSTSLSLSHSLVRSFVRSVYLFEDDSDVLYSGRKRLPPRGRSACLPLFSTGFWPRLYLVDISSVSRRSRSKLIIAPVRAARSEGISRSRAPIPI